MDAPPNRGRIENVSRLRIDCIACASLAWKLFCASPYLGAPLAAIDRRGGGL